MGDLCSSERVIFRPWNISIMSWHFHLSFFLSLAKIRLSEGESKSLLAPPSTMVVCLIMAIRKRQPQARPKSWGRAWGWHNRICRLIYWGRFSKLVRGVLGLRPPFLAMAASKQAWLCSFGLSKGSASHRDPKRKLKRCPILPDDLWQLAR